MKKVILFLIFLTILSCKNNENNPQTAIQSVKSNKPEIKLSNTKIILMDANQTKNSLLLKDEFYNELTTTDMNIRMSVSNSNQDVKSKGDFFSFASNQALELTDSDIELINSSFIRFRNEMEYLNIKLDLPEYIYIGKTTGAEELFSHYTRSNYIYIPQNAFIKSSFDEFAFKLIHELFHIYSRNIQINKPELYERLNAAINHFPSSYDTSIDFKGNLVITNPDSMKSDYFFKDSQGKLYFQMVYVDPNYLPSDIWSYIKVVLCPVGTKSIDLCDPVSIQSTSPRYYWDQIGYNTPYIVSSEEILADTFVLIFQNLDFNSQSRPGFKKESNVSSPEIISKVVKILETN